MQGEIVQSFLQRTVDVLRQSGSFTTQVVIYLIQCDAEVQSVERITSLDQLDALIPKLRLRGFGGYYGQGFQEALKVIGKIEKPKFRLKNLPNYVFIQLWLVVGLFQYIVYRAQRALKIT